MSQNEKKVGILTFHASINNGAVMQAYALSKRIKQENPNWSVEIIDYQMPKVVEAYRNSAWKRIKSSNPILFTKRFVKYLLAMDYAKKMNKRTKVFEKVRDMLPLSSKSILSDETEELFAYINETYDAIVVGSDAVWNSELRGFPNAYFPDATVTVKKLSYAASCYGMDFFKKSEAQRHQICEIFRDFSFLGVRDTATEDMVRWSACGKLPVHVCDPTVLLNIDELPVDVTALTEKLRERGFDFSRPTIGIMGSDKLLKMIRRLFGKKYQIAALYVPLKGADVNLYDLTPYEWAYVFRYFKMTFTTYFHGTLLSLRNGVPVVCFALKTEFAKQHTPKTLDVLKRLGYEEWYFETDYMEQNIDAIKKTAEMMLNSDLRSKIIERMDLEAQSFSKFQEALLKAVEGNYD